MAVLFTVCEISARMEVDNHPHTVIASRHSGGGTSRSNSINMMCTSLKSTFSGLQFCHWKYGSIFIRLAVVATQICDITR